MTTTNNSAATRERPILFSAPMVRAILDGTKTQTRRIVKPQPKGAVFFDGQWLDSGYGEAGDTALHCPYGQAGDRLWVRETWQFYDWTEYGEPCIRYAADDARLWPDIEDVQTGLKLMDVWAALSDPENYTIDNRAADRRWRPSIHMPRWACRIVLEVTGVRVERLQCISESDADAECFGGDYPHSVLPHLFPDSDAAGALSTPECFAVLWESINGAGSWAANPWVWVVEFKRVDNSAGRWEGL